MAESDRTISPAPNASHLRVVRAIHDEEQPAYDADHVALPEPRVTFRMVPDAVLDLRNPDATQLYAVLLRLARGKPSCTASFRTLGELCGFSDRHAIRTVALLEERGFLYVEPQGNGGMKLPNRYTPVGHKNPVRSDVTPVRNDMTGDQSGNELVSHRNELVSHVKETYTEIKRDTPPTPSQNGVPVETAECRAFIDAYPSHRRKSATEIRRAWADLNLSPEEVRSLMADLERRKQSTEWQREDGRYVPNAVNYLDQRPWVGTHPGLTMADRPAHIPEYKWRMRISEVQLDS